MTVLKLKGCSDDNGVYWFPLQLRTRGSEEVR